MAGQRSRIQAIEPTGIRILPGVFGGNFMIVDAILSRLGEGSVGELKHAERARGWTIDFKRMPRPLPAPVRARNGIAVAFDLRQRGEQFRRDNAGRILLKKRAVTLPCGCGSFCQGATDRGEELAGFPDYLIDPVKREEGGKPNNAPPDDISIPEEIAKPSRLSPAVSDAAMNGSCHATRLTSR